MSKTKFDKDAAFKRIAGIKEPEQPETEVKNKEPLPVTKKTDEVSKARIEEGKKGINEPALFRISPQHIKAIKMRLATSNDPMEKDKSSIVRAALDIYLKKELEEI